jgi:hypothetical protein
MCSRAKITKNDINPGSLLSIWNSLGTTARIWGPKPYNARLENLNGYWKNYRRGYTILGFFYEGDQLFTTINECCYIAVVYNLYGCAIVTKSSKGTIIEPHHHRMPLILEKPTHFITPGKIVEIDYNRLLKIA